MQHQENRLPGIGVKPMLDMLIKIGVLVLLFTYCFIILKPFLIFGIWGVVITVTIFPAFEWLTIRRGVGKKLAAFLITGMLLLIVVLPLVFLGESLAGGISYLVHVASEGGFTIPAPPPEVADWPVVGTHFHNFWLQASTNLEDLLMKYSAQIQDVLLWVVKSLTNVGTGFLLFILSIIVAGFFLVFAESGGESIKRIVARLAGDKGDEYLLIAKQTIRKVAIGIIGVPMLQSVLAGLGFLAAGVPAAGLWALAAFILGIVQIGLGPVVIPVLIYVFFMDTTLTFILLTIWSIPIFLLDNILKPLIFGRNAPVPMLVVFIGSIGGFLASGIIGLFVGAVVLTIGYRFFRMWVTEDDGLPDIYKTS